MPRPGGEADKVGNRYEGIWTARQLLYVLAGTATAVTVEVLGEEAEGAEFLLERGQRVEAHQVKRQAGAANAWSVAMLRSRGVLAAARSHIDKGREFHFVSTIPCQPLEELGDQARSTGNLEGFTTHMLSGPYEGEFNYLGSSEVCGSKQRAWELLRGFHMRCQDERDLRDVNATLASLLVEGASGVLIMTGLIDLVLNKPAVRLDAHTLERLLPDYELRRAGHVGNKALIEQVQALTAAWRAGVGHELLRPAIPRTEASQAAGQLCADRRVMMVCGSAGSGKSAVLHEALAALETAGWPALAFRLDRLGSHTTTLSLGAELGLPLSPVTALAAASAGRPCVLLIDQLDAVSSLSGRMPESFDTVAALLREAQAYPHMRVLLACRAFDAQNDERIRSMVKELTHPPIEVAPLDDGQLEHAVAALGLRADTLTAAQRDLLRSPLNLLLLSRTRSRSAPPGTCSTRTGSARSETASAAARIPSGSMR